MCTGISRITQHEDVPRHGVKDGLKRHSGISTSDDGRVRCLSQINQILTHLLSAEGVDGIAFDEALITFLRWQDGCRRWAEIMEDFAKGTCANAGTVRT